jgi:hypothetical protein
MLVTAMASGPDNTDGDYPPFSVKLDDDDEMIDQLWWRWVVAQTKAKGIPLRHCSPQLIEIIRLETLKASASHAASAPLLQVMKFIAIGQRARAAKMFRELVVQNLVDLTMINLVATAKRKQSERASLPRGNELTLLVRQIVKKRPEISEPELLALLEKRPQQGCCVLEDITDGIINWRSKKPPTARKTNVSALRSILSREKSRCRRSR